MKKAHRQNTLISFYTFLFYPNILFNFLYKICVEWDAIKIPKKNFLAFLKFYIILTFLKEINIILSSFYLILSSFLYYVALSISLFVSYTNNLCNFLLSFSFSNLSFLLISENCIISGLLMTDLFLLWQNNSYTIYILLFNLLSNP